MSIIPEEERFYKNTIVMAHAIYESVKKLNDAGYKTIQPDLIDFAIRVISAFDKHYLIQGFIINSHEKCWDSILKRDEDFFVTNASDIFKYLPMDKVNLFKDLFLTKNKNGESVVPVGLKEDLWILFDAMVKISIKYIHKNRDPHSYSKDDNIINAYGSDFFEEINIDYHANNWKIKLEFPPKI